MACDTWHVTRLLTTLPVPLSLGSEQAAVRLRVQLVVNSVQSGMQLVMELSFLFQCDDVWWNDGMFESSRAVPQQWCAARWCAARTMP